MSDVVYSSARQGRVGAVPRDIIRHRGLLRDLVSKELRARYRNAMMGFVWAILQPLLMTLILTFVFTVVFRAGGHGGRPALGAVSILTGLIFWQFLFTSLLRATNSLIENQELIKKVNFPRETIPLAAVLNCLVNLGIGVAVLLIVYPLIMREAPPATALWVPIIFAVQFALVVGLALLCSALNVYYHDVGYLLEVILTFGFYASPVFYRLSWVRENFTTSSMAEWIQGHTGIAPEWVLRLYLANPMAGIITAYRQVLLDGQPPEFSLLIWPALCAAAALVAGAWAFRRLSPRFADYL